MPRPVRSAIAISVASVVTIAASPRVRAYDAEIDAQTIGQAYQVRGLTGDPVLSRRRVVQSLQLGVYNITDTSRANAPEVFFRARMRLDADFGISRDEYLLGSQWNRDRFVPLLQPAPVELMYGYLEGRKFAGGLVGFKVGRQYVVDPLGYYAFDGALVKVTTPAYFSVEGYGGWEVRGGLPLSSSPQIGRWEMPGVMRVDRSDYPPNAYPSVMPQSLAPVWGVSLETAGPTWIHGKLTYRKAYNTGTAFVAGSGALLGPNQMGIYDRTRVAHERIGYGVNATLGDLAGVRGNLIWDLYGKRWSNVELGTDVYVGKRVTASVDYSFWRPIFDADSIFNVFGYEPIDDFTGRVEVDVTDRLNVAADAMVRRYRSDDVDAAQSSATVYSVASHMAPGGGLRARYRWPTARMMLRGSGITGDQGRRVGADVSYEKVFAERYLVDGRLSLWNFSDKLRADANGNTRDATSLGYVIGAGYKFTPESNGMLQFEHDINRLVGMRYRILALLNVRVWL